MIKISLVSSIDPVSYTFDKETLIIGDGPNESCDISFPSEGLHKNHIKITVKDGECTIINQANDPFVTLNGQPFWKKKLQINDAIQIRSHKLIIEQISDGEALPIVEAPLTEVISSPPPPIVKTVEPEPEPAPVYVADDSSKVNPLIEEAYNLEDHKQPRKKAAPQKPYTLGSNRLVKVALLFGLFMVVVFSVIFLEIYFRASSKIGREEMIAAESISDYAMALQYAKVYHIAPQKQNWIDPQFLKNNLIDLLSTTSLPCGNIDSQGQFSNCPYILRFYTNRDFSRFLLLAQPDATFSEWIIPKKTIIVDSSLMEVHKTDDLKTLNRLLSYPTPLDGANGDEIRRAILQTEVISLETLAKETGKSDFSPPAALEFLKPGAENLIYNAPRYHLFGENFLKKAIELTEERFDNHEMHILQSELDTLAKFHDLVFYSSSGMKQAFKGYNALQKLVIPSRYFTGYLVTSKEGKIISSRLIIDNDLDPEDPLEEKVLAERETQIESIKVENDTHNEISIEDFLREKVETAQEEIGPIIYNIYSLLEDVIEKDSLYLPPSIHQLFDLYLIKKEEMNRVVKTAVEEMRKIHPDINDSSIDHFLREYGLLDFYINDTSPDDSKISSSDPQEIEQWESIKRLSDIGNARTLVPFKTPFRI